MPGLYCDDVSRSSAARRSDLPMRGEYVSYALRNDNDHGLCIPGRTRRPRPASRDKDVKGPVMLGRRPTIPQDDYESDVPLEDFVSPAQILPWSAEDLRMAAAHPREAATAGESFAFLIAPDFRRRRS